MVKHISIPSIYGKILLIIAVEKDIKIKWNCKFKSQKVGANRSLWNSQIISLA